MYRVEIFALLWSVWLFFFFFLNHLDCMIRVLLDLGMQYLMKCTLCAFRTCSKWIDLSTAVLHTRDKARSEISHLSPFTDCPLLQNGSSANISPKINNLQVLLRSTFPLISLKVFSNVCGWLWNLALAMLLLQWNLEMLYSPFHFQNI